MKEYGERYLRLKEGTRKAIAMMCWFASERGFFFAQAGSIFLASNCLWQGCVPLKIGEILELTQTTMSLAEIARDQLKISKLPATKALYSINDKKGWYYGR